MRFVPLIGLLLAACTSIPDSYAPPIQRQPLSGVEPKPFTHFVNMNDPNAEAYFVADIKGIEGGVWRWTGKRPVLRFFLEATTALRFTADYTVSSHTLKDTGPVTLAISINGKPFEKVRHDKEGDYRFDHAVPAPLLKANDVNEVAIDVTPFWTSPADGNVLGFILTRAGFAQ